MLKLVIAGRDAIEKEATDRVSAVDETAGVVRGGSEPGDLEKLRKDWRD